MQPMAMPPMSGSRIIVQGMAATRSTSTRQPGTSRPVVPTVVRGGGVPKNSFHTSSKAPKLFRSVWNTCALTTLSSEVGGLERPREVLQHVAGLALDVRSVERKGRVHAGGGR